MAPSGPRRRRPRWHFLLLGLALLVLLLGAGVMILRQPAVATRFTNSVLARVHPVPRSAVLVGEVRGDWVTHLELRGVRVVRGDTLLASIDTLRARYDLASLLAGRLHVRDLELSGVFVSADIVDTTRSLKEPRKSLTLADLLRGRFYTGPPIRADRLSLTNATYTDRGGSRDSAVILDRVSLHARDVKLGHGFSFQVDSLALGRAPHGLGKGLDFGITARLDRGRFEAHSLRLRSDSSSVDGSIVLGVDNKGALTEARLSLHAKPLSLRDLKRLAPGLDLEGAVVADIDVTGASARQMSGRVAASCDHGRWGPLSLEALRLDATFTDGRADTKLSGVCGQARLMVTGSCRPFDATPTYDLVARTDRLPDQIPGAAWWADLARRAPAAVTMGLRGTGYSRPVLDLTGRVTSQAGDIGVDGHLDGTRDFTWSLKRLVFDQVDVARWIGDSTSSSVSGTLSAAGQSAFPGSRRIVADLKLAASRYGVWNLDRGRVRVRLSAGDLAARLGIDGDFDLEGGNGPATASLLRGHLGGNVQGIRFLSSPDRALALRDGRVAGTMRLDLDSSRVAGRAISDASFGTTLAGGRVSAQVTLASAAGNVDLSAHGRPFDAAPSFVLDRGGFDGVDLAAWTGTPSLHSRISGNLSGQARPGTKTTEGSWEGMLQLDRSRITTLDITGAQARSSWSNGEGSLVVVVLAAGDTVSLRGQMNSRAGTPHGHADLTVPLGFLATVAGRDSLKTAGSVVAEASFVGTNPATAEVDGTIRTKGTLGDLRIDSLFAAARMRRGTLELDTLLTRSNVGFARGTGEVALFDTSATATSHVNALLLVNNASPLRSLLGADTVAVDTARVELGIRGQGRRRALDAKFSARLLAWNSLRLRSAAGTLHADLDSQWRLSRARGDVSLQRLRGLGVPMESVALGVDFDGVTTVLDLRAARDEAHEVHLVAKSMSDSVGSHVALETLDMRAGTSAWALTRPSRIDYGGGRISIDDLDLRSSSGRVHARGVIDRKGEQSFRLEMNEVGLDLVSALIGRTDLTGTLAGTLQLDGPAVAPRGTGGIDLKIVAGGHPAGTIRSRLAWNGQRLDFGGHFANPTQDSLAWTGSLPLKLSLAQGDTGAPARVQVLEGDLDVRLLARRFPLRSFSPLLDPRSVGPLEGVLDVDARLSGSSQSIRGGGKFDVSGGVVPLPALGVVYRDVVTHATLQGDRILLSDAHAVSKKGRIDANGEIRLVSMTRVEPRLHVKSRKFVAADAVDLKAIVSGDLDVTGSLTSPVVKGSASVENSSFTIGPSAGAPSENGPAIVLTDADVRMLEETFGDVSPPPTNSGFLLYDASDLDLQIALEGNNWIRQNTRPKLSLALAGNVHLKKAAHGEPQLFGRIAPIPNRGYVEQFARSFDITGGEVILNGPMKAHRVDIQARYKPSGDLESGSDDTVIKLDVQGTVEKMNLILSSEPAMSEAEIVSYIATGHSPTVDRESGTTSKTGDSRALAADVGLSQIAGFAEEPAREAVGLDVLQVRFDAVKGATLVAGRYLDPQLYVGFRQPLQYKETTSPSAGENNRTSVEVEYAVHQWLVVNLQGETSKLRSFIRARHAY